MKQRRTMRYTIGRAAVRRTVRIAGLALALAVLAACGRDAAAPPADADPPKAPATTSAPQALPEAVPEPQAEAGTAEFPRFTGTTVEGEAYDLAARRGKWVVVNFWATWCKPCLKEMPELSALDAMREHVEVLGLAYEEIELEDMREFLRRHPVVYPVVILDVYDPPADFATPRGLPMTYLIAPDGRVAKEFLGPVTAQEIEQAIASAPEAPAG